MTAISTPTRISRLAGLGGLVGPIVFVLVVIIAGSLYEGYSHLSQAVSVLGATDSPVRGLQTLNFIWLGTTLIFFTLQFQRAFAGSSRLTIGLMLYFAIFTGIGNGVFSCDPGCEMVTITGILHNMMGLTGFIALSAAMFLLARRMRQDSQWSRWADYTRISGMLIAVFLVLWLAAGPAGNLLPDFHGVGQRLMIASFLQWYVVMGLYLTNAAPAENSS